MFGKGKSVGEVYCVQPQQTLAVGITATTQELSKTISSIGSDLTIVGRLICKDLIRVYGLVEGELNAANALIADGARIEGEVVAEELTIAGRVKGDVYALRVKLEGTAVVEGDIFHRVLSVDENARFEGCSWPEDDPPEFRPSIKAESSNPKPQSHALVPFEAHGERKPDMEEPTELQRTDMHAFLAACIAISGLGVISYFALSALQQARTRPKMSELIRFGWSDRHSLAGQSCSPVAKALLFRRRFWRHRKRQLLRRLLSRQSRRKRTPPLSTQSRCRRVSRRCRKQSSRSPSVEPR
jgi:cytoskeletal protein CcmA (bactofilin family)